MGFVAQDNAPDGMEAVRRLFAPEFRNRLDAIVQFGPLDEQTIQRVVDKLILEVEAQLEQKGVALHIEDDAR
jgi:ATP-dependent Clp protease ATP-binding subunit ClpA